MECNFLSVSQLVCLFLYSLVFLSCLSLLSRLSLCCMRSSCCGWVAPRGRWAPTGSRCSPSPPEEACWLLQRAGNRRAVTLERSLLPWGAPKTKAGQTTDSQNQKQLHIQYMYTHTNRVSLQSLQRNITTVTNVG